MSLDYGHSESVSMTEMLSTMAKQMRDNDVSFALDSHLGISSDDWEIVIYAEEEDCDISSIHQLLEVRQELVINVFTSYSLGQLKNNMQSLYEWLDQRGFGTGLRVSRRGGTWAKRWYNRGRLLLLDKLWAFF